MIVVVMGVSGSGKTTLGRALAARLGCRFLDGDDFHPSANVEKMRAGVPLDDADRAPWLERLNGELRGGGDAVLACSALKQRYRDALARGVPDVRLVHLRGSVELIAARLARRRHRYMPATLLQSQFDALEAPGNAIDVDVTEAADRCLERIVDGLRGS